MHHIISLAKVKWKFSAQYLVMLHVTVMQAHGQVQVAIKHTSMTNNAAALAGSHQLTGDQLCREGHSDSISCNSTREKKLTGVNVLHPGIYCCGLVVSAVAIEVATEETGQMRISRAKSLVL